MLAKEIVGKLSEIALAKKIKKIKKVYIEIGTISMSHDGHPEHMEDISPENLEFGLKSIAKDGVFKGTKFFIRKVPGESWKIVDIEV